MVLKVGDKAPDFSLKDIDSKTRHLSDFMGKNVVLAFFVTAFTITCSMETCRFRDSMDRLTDLKAQVIGVSTEDVQSNREFADRNHLPFPVLSDQNHETINAYGLLPEDAVGPDGNEYVKRSLFIVDKTGVIRYVWVANSATVEPDYEDVQRRLEKVKSKVYA